MDVEMPPSIPCQFNEAWEGQCKKPSTNGFCTEHEGKVCVSCGKTAVRSCDQALSLVCGALLCEDCQHSFTGEGHVTKAVFEKQMKDAEDERKETEQSRTSQVQRRNKKTGLPLNLFELLKGDWRSEGFRLEKCHLLMLTHGLMGFFPAIKKSDEQIVITTDEALLREIWKTLPPRPSEVRTFTGYIHEEKGVVYMDAEHQFDKEHSKPLHLLNRSEFEVLIAREADSKPFRWAPGLLGGRYLTPEEFSRMIQDSAKQLV